MALCKPLGCSTPGFLVLCYLLEFSQTHVHWGSDAIQLSHPLSPPPPPALLVLVFPSISDLLSPQWVSSSHQVAKGLELLLQHQPFNEESGLISFRMDWFDLLALQGTLKSLLHHRLKASVLLHSTFMVQHSHPSPVSLPGEFHGLKSLVGYSLWGQKELETTERLSLSHIRTWLLEKP